jgi:hypothetical protein
MGAGHRTLVDHVIAWTIAVPFAVYGLISIAVFVSVLVSDPAAQHGGSYIPLLLLGIGAVYGAAATLQDEFGLINSWRPNWTQGFVLAWFGGWTIVTIEWVVSDLRRGGLSYLSETGGAIAAVFGLFVVLPWLLTQVRSRSRRARS